MNVHHVHLYLHSPDQGQLDRIERMLRVVINKEETMSAELDALVAQVTASEGVEASALVAIHGLAQKVADLAAAGGTPQQFSDLATSMKASADALAAGIPA